MEKEDEEWRLRRGDRPVVVATYLEVLSHRIEEGLEVHFDWLLGKRTFLSSLCFLLH
jgi:hypothetical protein